VKASHHELPTFFVYDKYPGGIGLSEKVYDLWEELLMKTLEHVSNCPCESGYPSCIGAQDSLQVGKKRVIILLQRLNQIN
ncbi:Zn-binding domain-containing protein, partial [Lysinibacillus sp. D4B1_S16]|uniref:Zn-binding domain-containing protein n=1 Tax=Lysinibacillus sp. D4B1_S16 TaxID=2941231 RepID=UPI0020BED64A